MTTRTIIQNHNFARLTIIISSIFIMNGCIHDTAYDQFRHVPDNGWTVKDTLTYNVQLDSIQQNYFLSVETRNRGDYPYNDIYLKVMNNARDSTRFETDTLKLVLGTKVNRHSKWLGTGISNIYQMTHRYRSMTLPKRKGNIIFKIIPVMRDPVLTGMSDIGLKLSTSAPRQYEGK